MMHTNNQIIKHKVGLFNLAEELQNVSRACKVMDVSRDTFYRYQELTESGDMDALINKSRRVPNFKNRVDDHIEQAVIDYAIQYSNYGNIERVMSFERKVYLFQEVEFDQYGFAII